MNGIKKSLRAFYPGRTPERFLPLREGPSSAATIPTTSTAKYFAAAVELLSRAAVLPNNSGVIRVKSEGYDYFEIDLSELPVTAEERPPRWSGGVAAGFAMRDFGVGGFDAYVSSDVLPGSGLSSSASFEVLIGTVINDLGEFGLTPVEIARIGQYAENVYSSESPAVLWIRPPARWGEAIDSSAPRRSHIVGRICADFGGFATACA